MASNRRIDVQKFDGSRDVSRKSRNNNRLSLSPTRYGDANGNNRDCSSRVLRTASC